jgi:glycosyltransferase involved in cell wall biosynthesis
MNGTKVAAEPAPSTPESGLGSLRRPGNLKIGFVMHPFVAPVDQVSTYIWVHEVARRLAQTCSPIVYTAWGRATSKEELRDGVRYRRLTMPSETQLAQRLGRLPVLWRLRGSVSMQSGWYYWGHALRIAGDIRAQQCDIVHIINLSQFAPIIRALNPKAKIVLHMHGGLPGPKSVIERRLRKIDFVINCSDFFTDRIRLAFPQYASRCATVYNGVDTDLFAPGVRVSAPGAAAKRLLYVGAVSPHKGLHVLLEALPEVLKRFPEATLDIVGPPWHLPAELLPTLGDPAEMAKLLRFYDGKEYVSHLEDQIASLNLTRAVKFVGRLPHGSLSPYYRQSDVFILPSVCNEAFGMPAAEAMSSGVPVVASRVAGVPEVVENGKSGLLVDRDSPSALAEAIIRLLEDAPLRRSMAQAGRQRAIKLFSWDRITRNLIEVYSGLECTNSAAELVFQNLVQGH